MGIILFEHGGNMGKFLFLASSLLIVSVCLHTPVALDLEAQEPGRVPPGVELPVSVSTLPQWGQPAALVSLTMTTENLMAGGTLHNRSPRPIVAYRIGWLVSYREEAKRPPEIRVGEWVRLTKPVSPQRKVAVPSHSVSLAEAAGGGRRINFFVAAVRFADGAVWEMDRQALKEMFAPATGASTP